MKKMIMFALLLSLLTAPCFGFGLSSGWGSGWGSGWSQKYYRPKKNTIELEFFNLKSKVEGLIAKLDIFESKLEEITQGTEPQTDQKLLLKSGGDVIGELISAEQWEIKFKPNDDFEVATINSYGQLTGNWAGAYLFHKEYDCAGQGYQVGGSFTGDSPANTYTMFIAPIKNKLIANDKNLYYIPKGTPHITAKMLSRYGYDYNAGETKCINLDYSTENTAFLKAMPNDPAVTGIYTYPLKTPFTVDDWPSELIFE